VNRALKYLKEQVPPIFHRDIKFENVLIDGNGIVKLADLGLAATHDMGQTHTQGAGTPRWLAPEVLNGREYDYPSDQYSLALVALRILKGVLTNSGEIEIPAECRDPLLIEYLEQQLNSDPTKRMSAEDVLAKFKGRGSSTRGCIRLPPTKDRIISPDEIPWQKTTEDEPKANDELRRLALMFTASLDDEKDIAVIAETLKFLPFVGTWSTKRGIAMTRNLDGTVSLPRGVLGPTAPQTPFKAAFMKNTHGRDNDDSSSGERPRASGTAPVKRRLMSQDDDAEDDSDSEVAPTKKLSFAVKEPGRRRMEHPPESPSSKPARKSVARSSSNVSGPKRGGRRARDSAAEEEEDPETPTKKLSVKAAPPRRAAAKLQTRRASALADDDDEPEDDDADDMDVDDDGATSSFEEEDEEDDGYDGSKSKSTSDHPRAKKQVAPPVNRPSSKLTDAAAAPLATRRPTRAAAAPKEDNKRRPPPRRRTSTLAVSLETEKENWDLYQVEERVDKILVSAEWKTTLEDWSKVRRLNIPEEDEIKSMLHSLLSCSDSPSEREWSKSYDNSSFAKRLYEWTIELHGLWRENGRGKKRKRV
jgi:serine/threonine protein kinase